MAGGARLTLLSATLVASLGIAATGAVGQQRLPPSDPRLDGFTLRTGEERSEPTDGRLPEEPASPGPSDPGSVRNGSVRDGTPGDPQREDPFETSVPDEEPEPEPADLQFDLFEGPEQRTVPLARPVSAEPVAAIGARETPEAEPQGPPPALPFRTTGPVRSPTFAPAAAAERINRAAADLRPSFPILESDPYAPDGIRVGRFRLFPVLQLEAGYSDNLDDDPTERGGAFTQTTLTARFLSDWARHQADITASAGYRRNFGGEIEEDPRIAIDGRLALDLSSEMSALLRGALSFAREDPIQADPLLAASSRPDVLAYSFGGDLTRLVGPTSLTASADVVREERRVAGLAASSDFTTASAGLRAGYDLSPAFQPFASGSLGRRFFDDREPFTGIERDSIITALRGGFAFDFGEKISGEAALGYAWNSPQEANLETRGSPTLDVSVAWSPRRGTDVLLSAATFFDPEQSNLSTSTVYESAVALRHRATARTDLTARLSAAFRDRDGFGLGDDATYAGEAGVTYWLNRGLALTALARHERLRGDVAQAEYSANSVRVGLRFQR